MGERRLLIDGKLVDSTTGGTFDNVNPATLEVLGSVADATPDDMRAAIGAARRAFDTTTWATDHAFRRDCLFQLQAAIQSEQEELRAELVAEAGCPVLLTYGPQLDAPCGRRSRGRPSRSSRSPGPVRSAPRMPSAWASRPSARCGASRSAWSG